MFNNKLAPVIVALTGLLPSIDRAQELPPGPRIDDAPAPIVERSYKDKRFNQIVANNSEIRGNPELSKKLWALFELAESVKSELAKSDPKRAENYQDYVDRVLLPEANQFSNPISATVLKNTNNYELILTQLLPYLSENPLMQSRQWTATLNSDPSAWLERFGNKDAGGRFKAASTFFGLIEEINKTERIASVGILMKLYADPQTPDDFFESSNHAFIKAVITAVNDSHQKMHDLLSKDEDGNYGSRFGTKIILGYLRQVKDGTLQIEQAAKLARADFEDEYAALEKFSKIRKSVESKESDRKSSGTNIQQGEYLICSVRDVSEIRTDSLSKCCALVINIKNRKGDLTHIGLAHVDPGVEPVDIIRVADEAARLGKVTFDIVGGSTLNAFLVKRCLENKGFFVRCTGINETHISVEPSRSTNVAVTKRGQILHYEGRITESEEKKDREIDTSRANLTPKLLNNAANKSK